jgi:transcriptional regulator of aroF, aroG, tyrA and aromatic amino acid transport
MKALPDLVFALDIKGRLTQANDAVLNILRLSLKDIQGVQAGSFLKGFAFLQWFASGNPQPETCKLIFASEEFLADILPISIPDSQGIDHLAGAVVVLKSARRVGHHFNLLHSYDDSSFEYFCAESQLMQQLLHQARRFAMQDQPLLIMGETGSGKEMLVRACHRASLRANGPLLTLNCAALPDDVAEHELFGSAAGAFGPDWPGKMGLLEQASGGAFLLDEVAEMSPLLQSKLLRVLQDGRFHRVGQESEVAVDVRLYCTTRKSLAEQVRKGLFREDLFFRLNVLTLEMPTLRQRLADIMPLAQQFCSRISDELQRRRPRFSRSMTEFLNSYPWPGNVRQLKNALYQALTLLEGEELTPDMLRLPLMDAHESAAEQWFEEYNKEHDIDNSVLVNGRRQTNLGVFRAYLTNYLRSLPTVNQDMTCMVRQLQPTETGIPLELYFFSANKVWVAYEGIQADVFDHVLAIIPEFGLRVFQNPSGEDLRRIGVKIEH